MTRVPRASERLGPLYPARLERLLGCPLRVAFEQAAGPILTSQASGAADLGVAAHRALEILLEQKEDDLDSAWTRACDEVAERGGDPRSAPQARRAQLRLERRLPELLGYIDQRRPTRLALEAELTSHDRSLAGRVDLLVIGESPAVVDFKTGNVEDEDGLTDTYRRQLLIYAALAAEHLDHDVDAALFSLRQGIVPVDASTEVRAEVIAEANRARDAFDQRTPGPQPARPHVDRCGRCPFACHCDPAWEALNARDLEGLGWGEAVRGRVTGLHQAGSGVTAIGLVVDSGSVNGSGTIVDVPSASCHDLDVGVYVAAHGLQKRSEEPLTLVWRDGRSALQPIGDEIR